MHMINPGLNNTFGKRTSTRGGQVVDDFPAGDDIMTTRRKLTGHIMSRNDKKKNWENYKNRNQE